MNSKLSKSAGLLKKLTRLAAGKWLGMGFALKVGVPPDDYDKVSVMLQRGIGLRPRVAASATLGKESDLVLNRNAVALLVLSLWENAATASLVEVSSS